MPEFQEAHVHKEAGMASTICAATFPLPETINRGVVDLPDSARARLVLQLVADSAAPPLEIQGAVPVAVFRVEGVIIGDGRAWAEARWWLLPMPSADAADTVRAAVTAAGCDDAQYVTVLKPQFGDFLELLAAN
jgi:hypothetical protein